MIEERHRHRWEFNNEFRDRLSEAGLKITGVNPDNDLVEIIEIETTHGLLEYSFIPNSNPLLKYLIHCLLHLSIRRLIINLIIIVGKSFTLETKELRHLR
jgi:hypothetical protein